MRPASRPPTRDGHLHDADDRHHRDDHRRHRREQFGRLDSGIGLPNPRVACGAPLVVRSTQKLFGWFGGRGPTATTTGFAAIAVTGPGRISALSTVAAE